VAKLSRTSLLLLLGSALLLASCDNSFGAFANIQGQVEQKGTDTFKYAMVKTALRFGARYYAATGSKVFTRAVDGDWKLFEVDGSTGYSILAMANVGNTALYLSVITSAGSNVLYSYSGSAWSEVGGVPSGTWIDGLFVANDVLFAQAHANYENEDDATDDLYSLYYLNAGSLAATALPSAADPTPNPAFFVGVAHDGSSYWFATRDEREDNEDSALYQSDSDSPSAAVTARTTAAGLDSELITSIYFAHDGALYVGSQSGADLYRYDGSAWTHQDVGTGGPLTAIVDFGVNTLLVGEGTTDSYTDGGYYEGISGAFVAGDEGSVTLSASLYLTTLAAKAVVSFYWDATGQRLFACLAPGVEDVGYGLYSSALEGGVWTGWTAE